MLSTSATTLAETPRCSSQPTASKLRSMPHLNASETDATLAAEVVRAIRRLGYRELREIKVTVTETTIRIEGVVRSFYHKQVAQSVAFAVAPTRLVRNDLEVRWPEPTTSRLFPK